MSLKKPHRRWVKYEPDVLKIKFSDEIVDTIKNIYFENGKDYPSMNYLFNKSICRELNKYGLNNVQYCVVCGTIQSTDNFYRSSDTSCKKCTCHHKRALYGGNYTQVVESTGGKCILCGDVFEHIHHIIPRSIGGNDTLDNLVPLCKKCHRNVHNNDNNMRNGLNSQMTSMLITLNERDILHAEANAYN